MAALTWCAIFLAALAAILKTSRRLTLVLLAIGYGLAFASGQLQPIALVPIALLVGTGVLLQRNPSSVGTFLCNAVFCIIAVGLFQHWLPGFDNLKVVQAERLTPDAAPYTMYLNFDKPLVAFWLVLAYPWVQPKRSMSTLAILTVVACAATSAVCLLFAWWGGAIAWAPKWPHFAWLWVLDNVLLVAFAEEALFRGYIQGGTARLMRAQPDAGWFALLVGAVLFGLAHYQGGALLVLLAGLSGVGYGLAYRAGGLQSAMLAHFGVNLVQFGLLTYPFIARA
ncbi:CPBP family intramembrane metalloprotease domain-containing protein [Burkholderia pyrrocinia]|uniref:CPBP family intramembrane metalloprotease domain-containing protein n=1 Tax=Burkholderia pyrrocinia TaxID=60550 RepID=A0A2Z5N9D8_BURPY|nr:CPBP family intramembrane glutamic endopeptidase [Burkholderia pyrrocinia]AXF25740.1 CPBP family intramembrane metalloprotease domain-containing protein [Burkholderia pyrrocinia]